MRRIWVTVLLCCLLLAGTAVAEENLLVNGGFEEVSEGHPTGWETDMWQRDAGVTYMEVREGGVNGGLCAMIENVGTNDARFIQDVAVEPSTVYHISGWIKAEGIPANAAGASLSVIGAYAAFPQVYDTQGEWEYVEAYIKTDSTHEVLTIGVRLGDYSADNTGKAYFDNIVFAKAAEPLVVTDAEIIALRDYANPLPGEQVDMSGEVVEESSAIWPMAALFAIILIGLWMLRGRKVSYPRLAIWLVIAVGALIRLYFMATQVGYASDMACFFSWSNRMFEVGPNAFYSPEYFCDYPPGYMYLLWLTGAIMNLLGINNLGTDAARVVVKIMPFLADLGTIYLIWSLARRKMDETPSLLLAALYALSPAILVDGAIWGQVDAIVALGLLATVALVVQDNWKAAIPVFVVTVLMKPQALMAGPIGLVALVMDCSTNWKKEGKKTLVDALIGVLIGIAVAAAMLLPFLWGQAQPVSWIIEKYTTTLSSYPYATLNTANLYYLMGANWVPLDQTVAGLTYGSLGTILMVVFIAATLALYVWRRDKGMLPFFCAFTYIGLYMLGIRMHERYLFPAFALLLYAYVRKHDWRLLVLFIGFSVTFYLNCAMVLRDTHLALGHGAVEMVLASVNMLLLALGVWVAVDRKERPLPQTPTREPVDRLPRLEGRTPPTARMRGKDWASMLGLTLIYALVAFVGLGDTVAPQTAWSSTGASESVVFDLGEQQEFTMLYYMGISNRDHTFDVEFSADGENWTEPLVAKAYQGDCFRWVVFGERTWNESNQNYDWSKNPIHCDARYVRFTMDGPAVTIIEVGFHDLEGNLLPISAVSSTGAREESANDPGLLTDEQQYVVQEPSYMNSTYFDEIYHARTGYEHANGMSTYEWTHPPLGKVFIMFAIKLFGMTPFGWRFAGALVGVLMVPAMYMLGKVLFKKTRFAFLGAFIMAFDMMHLTQTRIATIDSYAVLFIILMYTCMFRYMQMSFFRDGWRTLIPLGLSGLFMGLGCASKWICMYAGVGLAVLFFWSLVQRTMEYRAAIAAGDEQAERVKDYGKYMLGTLGGCLVFFIAIPCAIYYFSYIPQFAYDGGLTWTRFWNTQQSMFSYHAGLVDDHPFQSPWYEWPLMLKPMYYYNGSPYVAEGMVSTIMCMGNPAVWWIGLLAFVFVIWRWMKPHMLGRQVTDNRPAILLVAFAAQFIPWVLVPRSMFIYHYFGSLPFVMLSIVFAFEQLHLWKPKLAQVTQVVYMVIVLGLFVGFYPLATGVQVSRAWADAMNWFKNLYLPGWKYRGWLFY